MTKKEILKKHIGKGGPAIWNPNTEKNFVEHIPTTAGYQIPTNMANFKPDNTTIGGIGKQHMALSRSQSMPKFRNLQNIAKISPSQKGILKNNINMKKK